jgi:hypothetical protein
MLGQTPSRQGNQSFEHPAENKRAGQSPGPFIFKT